MRLAGVMAHAELQVVGAVILRDDLVLCARRGSEGALPGLWEFPGGKVEGGESPQGALVREIDEELGCEVRVGEEVAATTHAYEFAVIRLTTFWCELVRGTPQVTEHAELRWVPRSELGSLDWAPADIPAVEVIMAGAEP